MTSTPNLVETEDNATGPEAVDPRAVREKAGLEPDEMAALIGMSAFGYRSWEAGSRSPGGPAYRLMALIGADPKGMPARLAAL